MRKLILSAVTVAFALPAVLDAADPEAFVPPIQEMKDIRPTADVFQAAKRGKPLELKTADEAAKFFGEEALAALQEKVDFDEQIVLVFAWRGSGQDKLSYVVAESFPEQITFTITPGARWNIVSAAGQRAAGRNVLSRQGLRIYSYVHFMPDMCQNQQNGGRWNIASRHTRRRTNQLSAPLATH